MFHPRCQRNQFSGFLVCLFWSLLFFIFSVSHSYLLDNPKYILYGYYASSHAEEPRKNSLSGQGPSPQGRASSPDREFSRYRQMIKENTAQLCGVFLGGDNRTRICDLSRVRRALYQLSYASMSAPGVVPRMGLVTRTRLELVLPP